MDFKIRFSLLFSLVTLGLVVGFSFLVYGQVRTQLRRSAENTLSAHLEHEWRHLERAGAQAQFGTLPNRDVSEVIRMDGQVLYDGGHSGSLARRITREADGHQYEITAYFDDRSFETYLAALRRVLWLSCIATGTLLLPLSFLFSRSLLSPFRRLAVKTSELSAEKLDFRFAPRATRDEYGTLVANFNALMDRLEKSFSEAKRFSINASHELRTPLTVLRAEGELALRRERSPEAYRHAISKMLVQAETIQKIVSHLLQLSELERRKRATSPEDTSVTGTVEDVVRALALRYPEPAKGIRKDLAAGLRFDVPRELLYSVLSNLIENALKFCRSRVVIRCRQDGDCLRLQVEDDGPGIPPESRREVFEPFAKAGRTREGHGMGLTIVQACVRSVKGEIRLGESGLGGLLADVRLAGRFTT